MSGNDVRADQLDGPTVLARAVEHLAGTYGSEFVVLVDSRPAGVRLLLAGEPAELRCTRAGEGGSVVVQVGTHPEVEISLAAGVDEVLGQIRECVLVPPTVAAPSVDVFVITDGEDAEVYRLPGDQAGADNEATNGGSEAT